MKTPEEIKQLRIRALARRFAQMVKANSSYAYKIPDEIIDDPLLDKVEDAKQFMIYLKQFGLKQRTDMKWEVA